MTQRFYIKTYGCQMNEYDSNRIRDLLTQKEKMQETKSPKEADLIFIITCSVREKAQEKLFSDLGRYALIKKKKPNLLIGVGGCVASQEEAHIFKRAPYVDLVFGPQTYHRLPELIAEVRNQKKPVIDTSFPEIEKFDKLPEPCVDGPTAFISIMEGCNKHCTYCIVPLTRGREFSRPKLDILAEILSLASQGVREVMLLGQNVNEYCNPDDQSRLAQLIHDVALINGIDRIRFATSHPTAFSDDLIDAYKHEPKLANHLHLPVQSGSDRILKLMGRGYTAAEYCDKIERLRAVRPGISISSDFIVGFPGETEEDFQATLDLVDTIQFDHSFSFIYSPRPGTAATKLKDNVAQETKKERLARLKSKLSEYEHAISQSMIKTTQTVLVTGTSKKNDQILSGRTENNRVVNFAGDKELIGQFVEITITEALPNSLRGAPLF